MILREMPATFALIKRNQKEVLVNATIRPYRHIQVIVIPQ